MSKDTGAALWAHLKVVTAGLKGICCLIFPSSVLRLSCRLGENVHNWTIQGVVILPDSPEGWWSKKVENNDSKKKEKDGWCDCPWTPTALGWRWRQKEEVEGKGKGVYEPRRVYGLDGRSLYSQHLTLWFQRGSGSSRWQVWVEAMEEGDWNTDFFKNSALLCLPGPCVTLCTKDLPFLFSLKSSICIHSFTAQCLLKTSPA